MAENPLATEDFVSMQAGTMPVPEFFDPANITRYLDAAKTPPACKRRAA